VTTDIIQAIYTAKEKGWEYPFSLTVSTAGWMSAKKGNFNPKYLIHSHKLALMNHLVIQGSLMKCGWDEVIQGLLTEFNLKGIDDTIRSASDMINKTFQINIVSGGLRKIFNSKSLVDG
jgi:hypothetical protein